MVELKKTTIGGLLIITCLYRLKLTLIFIAFNSGRVLTMRRKGQCQTYYEI